MDSPLFFSMQLRLAAIVIISGGVSLYSTAAHAETETQVAKVISASYSMALGDGWTAIGEKLIDASTQDDSLPALVPTMQQANTVEYVCREGAARIIRGNVLLEGKGHRGAFNHALFEFRVNADAKLTGAIQWFRPADGLKLVVGNVEVSEITSSSAAANGIIDGRTEKKPKHFGPMKVTAIFDAECR